MKRIRLGANQQKILLILLGGISLGLSRNPRQYFRTWKILKREWQKIGKPRYRQRDDEKIKRALKRLKNLGFVKEKHNKDGTVSFYLSRLGMEKAMTISAKKIKIQKPTKWDGKWRIITFDIPEDIKKKREVVRYVLRKIGFCELQKSVFIHPFDCKKEISYIAKTFKLKKYINFIVAEEIDNEKKLKKQFKI